jgi:O-glycosyl hydrolase
MTANYPAINLDSGENSWGNSAPYSLGQSFTATVSGTLTNIQMYFTGVNATNILYLYDMGPAIQYLPGAQPSPIVPGSNGVSANLFSTNLSVFITNFSGPSVIELSFAGADAVKLVGGHMYLFDVSPTASTQQYWYRDGGGTDLYPGGAAYRQNSLINGSETTDFSLAVTLINTNAGPTIYDCVVDWNNVHQRIDGFGACSAWRSAWTQAEANMFFSTNSGTGVTLDGKTNFSFNGVGLSLLRSRIAPGGTTVENSIMQMAQSNGATVWSTPWSPAAQFTTGDSVDGSDINPADYQAYANQLAGYVVNMKSQYNINLYAISVQNEPDASESYESCVWTAQQIHDFVPYLAGALAASNVASTKIVVAEDQHWETNYYATAMSDPTVATNVSIVACHNYDNCPPSGTPAALPLYDNTNAALWETETAELSCTGNFNGSISDAMYWAGRIHLFMTVAGVNAWHYWWLISDNADNEGLTDDNGYPALRMYVLGQYSRFVRPNNYRIDLANYNTYAVLATAYKDPVSNTFAIVVANTNATATNQSFYLTNFTATSVTPWMTSSNVSLAAQSAVTVTNSSFSYTIPAMSIITFVGAGLTNGTVPTVTTLSSSSSTAVYGTPVTFTANVSPAPTNGETVAFMNGGSTLGTGALSGGVATYTTTATQLVVASSPYSVTAVYSGDGYYGNSTSTNLAQTVTAAAVTVASGLTANNKTYDGTTSATISSNNVQLSGVMAADAGKVGLSTNGYTASFASQNAGNGIAVTVGSLTLSGSAAGNYSLTQPTLSANILSATVTVASGLTANNKTYDGTTSATISSNNVQLSGVVAADAGKVGLSTNGYTASFASQNAGNGIAVTVGGLTLSGSAAGNYSLTQPTLSANILSAAVTVASGLTANNKTYDGTTSATISSNNVQLSGVVAADAGKVGLSTNGYTASFASQNVGNGIAVTVGGLTLSGSAAGNYSLTQPTLSANILSAAVTLQPGSGSLLITNNFTSVNNQFVVYNGSNGFNPALNGALYTNFQCDVQFAPGSATQTNGSGVLVFGHLQFGTITASSGQDYFGGSTYGIDVPATNTGWVHVSIPVNATNDTNLASINNLLIQIYGPTYATTLIGPSTLWVDNIAFFGPNNYYIVDQFNPSGTGGYSYANGQIASVWSNWFGGAWVTNIWDSTNDAIDMAANNKAYDSTAAATVNIYDTVLNAALSGVLSSDFASVSLSTNGYTASFASAGVGSNIVVTVSNLALAGSAGGNYAVAPVTLNAGISSLPVTASAVANNKVYDGGTTATLTTVLSGVVSGDAVALNTNGYTATFATAEVDTNIAVTVSAWALTGSAASNYTLLTPAPAGLTADITPATATVTANNQSVTVGLPIPALTATYSGFVNGEDTNVLITPASLTTTAEAGSPVGVYPITASGATAANYLFDYVPGTLTVAAQPQMTGVNAGATGFELTFPTLPGQMYQVEYTTDLTEPWTPLGDPMPGTGGSLSITNNINASQGYFMLEIWQQ